MEESCGFIRRHERNLAALGSPSFSFQLALLIICSFTTAQCFTCLKKIFPAIFRPHLHVLTTRACFCARETGWPVPFETPYSFASHLAVAGSISDMLIWSPCFLQNSSNDLSVTNGSRTFSLLLQMNVWT